MDTILLKYGVVLTLLHNVSTILHNTFHTVLLQHYHNIPQCPCSLQDNALTWGHVLLQEACSGTDKGTLAIVVQESHSCGATVE